jgi:hypothetical protein
VVYRLSNSKSWERRNARRRSVKRRRSNSEMPTTQPSSLKSVEKRKNR